MPATDRLANERCFHDDQARRRAAWFARRPDQLRFSDDAYLDHETWIRPAFAQLGDVAGKRVLDFGCGHGMAAVVLARRGARVIGFDLSGGYVAEARARARANETIIDFVQADGERLPFADAGFDLIWGNAVLHHLDIPTAAAGLRRVLRPGGRAVFCEPWGENPLLRWARQRFAPTGKHTADEEPLRCRHVAQLRKVFPMVEVQGHQFLGVARRLLSSRFAHAVDGWDAWLLHRVPPLQRYCRYVVLTLRS